MEQPYKNELNVILGSYKYPIKISEIAKFYGVEESEIIQVVKDNPEKLPREYVFFHTEDEKAEEIKKYNDPKMKYIFHFPILFKREGAYMLATLLSSEKARETTKNIIEAFVGVCEITEKHDLIKKSKI